MVSAYPLSKTNQQHVTGLLKIQRCLAHCVLFLRNPFREPRTVSRNTRELPQGDCLIPTDNLLIIEREWVREREGGKKKWEMWSALNHLKYFNFAGADHQPLLPECHPQRTACLLLLSSLTLSLFLIPSPQTPMPLNLILFSHLLLWQSFNTVWLEFLSPVCTVCSKYLSTHWHSARRDLGNLTHGNDFN